MRFEAPNCPLCSTDVQSVLFSKGEVRYFSCAECGLVFMDPAHLPSVDEERDRYLQHNNDPGDDGYVAHLMDIGERVIGAAAIGASGLDYGCGTSQAMAGELQKRGAACVSYDPLFADDRSLLRKKYGFITCCEAIEHFHNPFVELIKLTNMLAADGVLGFKTSLIEDGIDYERWYYANDPSHVVFLRSTTIDWIARRFALDIVERDEGRFVFRRISIRDRTTVVAGLLERDGRLLVAKREGGSNDGKWEFPGGKIRDGETAAEALVREIQEEMSLGVDAGDTMARLLVPGPGRWLELLFVRGRSQGEPSRMTAHSAWRWMQRGDLSGVRLLEGDQAFCDMYL